MNSDVQSTLVLNAGDSIAAKDTRKDELAVGEIAVIDVNTGLAIDATNAANVRDFKVVKCTKAVSGVATQFVESPGFRMQVNNTFNLTYQCYTPYQAAIWKISGIKTECESSYAIGFRIDNSEINSVFGGSDLRAPVIIDTGCCGDDEGCCPDGDCQTPVKLFGEAITENYGDIVTVTYYDDADQVIADIDTWIANSANADKCPYFTLTTKEQSLELACGLADIPFEDAKVRGYEITPYFVSASEFADCGAAVEQTQDAIDEGLNAYDVRSLEYMGNRYQSNDNLYRQSAITGRIDGGPSQAVDGSKYGLLTIQAKQNEETAEFVNRATDQTLNIAIECGEAIAGDLGGIFDALYGSRGFSSSFEADIDACPACDSANVTDIVGSNVTR